MHPQHLQADQRIWSKAVLCMQARCRRAGQQWAPNSAGVLRCWRGGARSLRSRRCVAAASLPARRLALRGVPQRMPAGVRKRQASRLTCYHAYHIYDSCSLISPTVSLEPHDTIDIASDRSCVSLFREPELGRLIGRQAVAQQTWPPKTLYGGNNCMVSIVLPCVYISTSGGCSCRCSRAWRMQRRDCKRQRKHLIRRQVRR